MSIVSWTITRVLCCNVFICNFQNIDEIPADIKALYKTVWEIPQRSIIQMAADRGAFIDQSQSLNIHIAEPNYGKLTSMHFYSWKLVSKARQAECTRIGSI